MLRAIALGVSGPPRQKAPGRVRPRAASPADVSDISLELVQTCFGNSRAQLGVRHNAALRQARAD